MSFLTYRLSRRLRTVGEGATQAHYGEVEAIIKQDHAQARVQVYSELVANRLAALIGVDVATGALVAHDTGLKFASLRLSNIAAAQSASRPRSSSPEPPVATRVNVRKSQCSICGSATRIASAT